MIKVRLSRTWTTQLKRHGGVMPLWGAALLFCGVDRSLAVTHLKRGDVPPPFSLADLSGSQFTLGGEPTGPVILVFGELYHPNTVVACEAIQMILADRRIQDCKAACRLIITQKAAIVQLRDDAKKQRVTVPILHDVDRKAFAAYQVSVLPSTVIVDVRGRVVHALAGVPPTFRDVVTDAVLFGAGKIKQQDFERTLQPQAAEPASQPSMQAARLTELARQLVARGMDDFGKEKFREALSVDASFVPALIGLGRCELKNRRLPGAEEHFRAALQLQPDAAEANLGLVYVQTLRGGDELKPAEERVRALLASHPNHPEAHYLLGLIHDQSGRSKEAAASYKKAAELLLARGGGD